LFESKRHKPSEDENWNSNTEKNELGETAAFIKAKANLPLIIVEPMRYVSLFEMIMPVNHILYSHTVLKSLVIGSH
jgi:hypothetical protein